MHGKNLNKFKIFVRLQRQYNVRTNESSFQLSKIFCRMNITSPFEMIGSRNQSQFTNKIYNRKQNKLVTLKKNKNSVKIERFIFDYQIFSHFIL